MSVYEWMELTQLAASNSIACVAILITVVFAYLVAAYVVGDKLTSSQIIMINSLFLIVSFWLVFCIVAFLTSAVNSAFVARGMSEEVAGAYLSRNMPVGVAVMDLFIIVGCLKFMWDIRHPKAE